MTIAGGKLNVVDSRERFTGGGVINCISPGRQQRHCIQYIVYFLYVMDICSAHPDTNR